MHSMEENTPSNGRNHTKQLSPLARHTSPLKMNSVQVLAFIIEAKYTYMSNAGHQVIASLRQTSFAQHACVMMLLGLARPQ